MTTITDIRNDLIEVFNGLKAGTIEPKQAVETNNTAGKIISSAKVQLAYHALRGEAPNIPFLAGDTAVQLAAPARKQLTSVAMRSDGTEIYRDETGRQYIAESAQ